jgi:hypothetical protein
MGYPYPTCSSSGDLLHWWKEIMVMELYQELSMRMIDDSRPKYAAVLKVLQAWKQLPESDVARMVRQYYLITDDFREMEDQGLLTMTFVGDEYMLASTLLGRIWLEEYSKE